MRNARRSSSTSTFTKFRQFSRDSPVNRYVLLLSCLSRRAMRTLVRLVPILHRVGHGGLAAFGAADALGGLVHGRVRGDVEGLPFQ